MADKGIPPAEVIKIVTGFVRYLEVLVNPAVLSKKADFAKLYEFITNFAHF
jgi:hypothetical protein